MQQDLFKTGLKEMAFELISEVLQTAANPGATVKNIAQQMKALTGGKLIIITRASKMKGADPEFAYVYPESKSSLISDEIKKSISNLLMNTDTIESIGGKPDSGLTRLLRDAGMEISVLAPLVFGKEKIGHICILGLPERANLDMIRESLSYLSPALSTIFRFSELYDKMEKLVDEKSEQINIKRLQLRQIIDSIPEMISLRDGGGKFQLVNKKFSERVGKDFREIIGKDVRSILTDEDKIDELLADDRKVLESGIATETDIKTRVDEYGKTTFYRVKKIPVEFEDGEKALLEITSDITEREKLFIQLREEKDKFQFLFESSNDAVFLHDLKGKIVDCNSKAIEILGYTKEELLRKNIRELHPETAADISNSAFQTIVKEGRVTFDIEFIKKNGEPILTEISSSLIEMQGTKYIQGVVRDITERTKATALLRESRERLSLIFNNSSDIIFLTEIIAGEEQKITAANPSALKLTGFSESEIIGKLFSEILPEDDAAFRKAKIREIIETKKPTTFHRKERFPAGELDIEKTLTPIFNEQGEVTHVLSISRDLSESARAEKALFESEERFRTLFNNSPDMLLSISPKDNAILECNRTFLETTGFAKQEVVGSPVFDIFAAESVNQAHELFDQFISDGRIRNAELLLKRKNGSFVDVSLNVDAVRDKSGEILYSVSTLRDITELRRSQKKLKESHDTLEGIMRTVPLGIGLVADGKCGWANNGMYNITGYTAEESLRQSTSILYENEAEQERVEKQLYEGMRSNGIGEVETKWKRKDGSVRDVFLRAAPLDSSAPERGYIETASDVTLKRKTDEAFKALATTFSQFTGKDFYEKVTAHLAESLGFEHAFVGELNDEGTAVQVLGGFSKGGKMTPFEYELAGTPCRNVIGLETCIHKQNVANKFPEDVLLAEMNLEGYIGTPLFTPDERPLGIMVLLSEKEIENPEIAQAMLSIFADRVSAEILRDRVQTKLKESELRFREIFENSGDGIFIHEISDKGIPGKFLEANRAAVKMLGYSVEELRQMITADINDPEYEQTLNKIRKNLVTNNEAHYEMQLIAKDGRKIPVEVTGRRFFLQGKNVVASITRDLTQARRMELELKDSEERFKQIFMNTSIGFYRTTPDGQILIANPALIKILGFDSLQELKSLNLEAEGFQPDYPRSAFKAEIEAKGRVEGWEQSWLRNDGTKIYIRENARLIRDELNNKTYYEGTIEDVTRHRKAEEAYHTIVQNSLQGMTIYQNGRIVFSNPRVTEILGYSPDEIKSMPPERLEDMVHPEDRNKIKIFMSRLAKGELNDVQHEARYRSKSGEYKWLRVSYMPTEYEGKPAAIAFSMDITSHKEASAKIAESEERFKHIFDSARVAIWEEDFSELKKEIDRIKTEYEGSFRQYLEENRDNIISLAKLIRVKDVNRETLRQLRAENKQVLLDSLEKTWLPESFEIFKEELITIAEGGLYYESEAVTQTLDGKKLHILLRLVIPEGKYENVLVSTMDITPMKKAEYELLKARDDLELKVSERTRELQSAVDDLKKKNEELNNLNNMYIEREFRIKELNIQIDELEKTIEKMKDGNFGGL